MSEPKKPSSAGFFIGGLLFGGLAFLLHSEHRSSTQRFKEYSQAPVCTTRETAIQQGNGAYVILFGSAETPPGFHVEHNGVPVLMKESETEKIWKSRGTEKEEWVSHVSLESRNVQKPQHLLIAGVPVSYIPSWIENGPRLELVKDELTQPDSVKVFNVMSNLEKTAGFRNREWIVPRGQYTAVGVLRNSYGNWGLYPDADKFYCLLQANPSSIASDLKPGNGLLYTSVASGVIGGVLFATAVTILASK